MPDIMEEGPQVTSPQSSPQYAYRRYLGWVVSFRDRFQFESCGPWVARANHNEIRRGPRTNRRVLFPSKKPACPFHVKFVVHGPLAINQVQVDALPQHTWSFFFRTSAIQHTGSCHPTRFGWETSELRALACGVARRARRP
jgi:hypothetical protein